MAKKCGCGDCKRRVEAALKARRLKGKAKAKGKDKG